MRLFSLLLIAVSVAGAADSATVSRWRMQYFYDTDEKSFAIADLAFSSPQRGIAVGTIVRKKGRPAPMSVITRDGGAHWTEVPLADIPVSLFLLNDNVGWMVTEKGLWRTDEAGRTWKKIKSQRGLRRVYFRNELLGWMTGAPKLFRETKDGGKTWTDIAAAKEVSADPENTYYDWIEWRNDKQAIVLGANVAPRRSFEGGSWMDPEKLSRRREWPGLNITLETSDGGSTWNAQTVPTFGRFYRFRIAKEYVNALSLIRFTNTFQYGSEVYLIDGQGKSTRVYRNPVRNVTDLAWLGKTAILAAVEPPGKLHQLPIPGKVHVLSSNDARVWTEMKVDYRAFGTRVMIATAGTDAWIATDSGQILKLMN